MRPSAFHLSTQTLRRRLPPFYQTSALLRPLSRPQNSPQNTTHGYRFASTPPAPAPAAESSIGEPLPEGSYVDSSQGKRYIIGNVLTGRKRPRIWHVYSATHEGKNFRLNDIVPAKFDSVVSLQERIKHSRYIQTAVDSIPERHMLVYPRSKKSLARLGIAALSSTAKKAIIKDVLTGLEDLHDKHIIHNDIKPANIMMDTFKEESSDITSYKPQISGLQRAVVLSSEDKGLTGRLSRLYLWRSPEAWAEGIQNTPSDIYSFALVAILVWTGRMVLLSGETGPPWSNKGGQQILRNHLSYFGGETEDFEGFVRYHGGDDNPFVQRVKDLLSTFNEERPREPFSGWTWVDPRFRDLICKMTCMDPLRRITAREALGHPWFAED
ncbi:kinase-like domain-containing protein [Dichotomopilus funicola]|uniref:Kinase-like domain-containing protein n=1 Tax=Dichotomopilus funicola TaxID=1934379 RepID=A0AAN6ZM77_9PEZI|nr:kinase-like domain-containing protein [Dichotomopilus funicola]